MKENSGNRVDQLVENALRKIPDHDITTALTMLLEAGEIEPYNIEIINLLAVCYYVLGEFRTAKSCWEKAVELEESNRTALSQLEQLESPSFQFYLKRYYHALRLVENRKFTDAIVLLRQLLEEHDGFVSIYQALGVCYLACSDEKNARKVWNRGLKLDKSNKQLINYLQTTSMVRTSQSQPATQKEVVPRPRTNRNRLVWLVSALLLVALVVQTGIVINNNRDSNETIQDMQAKIKSLSERLEKQVDASPVSAWLESSQTADQILKAEESVMEGSDYDLEKEGQYYDQGYNAYLKGEFKTAISNLGVVVAMNTGSYLNREAMYYLARTYYLSQDYDNAKRYYLQYLDSFPDSNYFDDSLFYLGCLSFYTEDYDSARKYFTQLKEFDPESGYLSTNLYKKVMDSLGQE